MEKSEKTVKAQGAKTIKANDLNSIFEKATANLQRQNRQGATLYQGHIFEGKTDKEKKAIRVKLRKTLDNFCISAKQSEKNPEKLALIKKDWQDYATMVYINASNIVDANSGKDKVEMAQYFLKQMS